MVNRSPCVTGSTSCVVSARKQMSVPGTGVSGTRSSRARIGPVQHQRAAAVAFRCGRLRECAEEDHRGHLAEARIVVDQRRVAVLMRYKEIAGQIAQELRRLA